MVQDTKTENLAAQLRQLRQEMVTRQELDRIIETILILSNEETMRKIRRSQQEIKEGKVSEIQSVDDL